MHYENQLMNRRGLKFLQISFHKIQIGRKQDTVYTDCLVLKHKTQDIMRPLY